MKTDELKKIQDQAIGEITMDADHLTEFLKFQSLFKRYSCSNTALIFKARQTATLVLSFTGWKKLHRYIKKGENGIPIWCPAKGKVVKTDPAGKPILNSNGEKETEDITYFKVGYVFDISQTEGEDLPDDYHVDEDPWYETEEDLFEGLQLIDNTLLMDDSEQMLINVFLHKGIDVPCSEISASLLASYMMLPVKINLKSAISAFRYSDMKQKKKIIDKAKKECADVLSLLEAA